MEKIFVFGAYIGAFVFGLGLELLKWKDFSRKHWKVVAKVGLQIICVVSYLCTFISMFSQTSAETPAWAIALMSLAPVLLLGALGNLMPDLCAEIILTVKSRFKNIDKNFLLTCLLIVMISVTGVLACQYLHIWKPLPTVLWPVMVVIAGGFICGIAGIVLLICYFIIRVLLYLCLISNIKSLAKKYWKWLTN